MKRSNIIYGLTCIILSGISLYIAIIFDANKMSGVFYGLTGALGVGGIVSIFIGKGIMKNMRKN